MDKYNNVVIKEKTSKTNIVIIIISIIVLVAGGVGIWWFIDQENKNEIENATEIIEQVEAEAEIIEGNDAVAYNGVEGKTATELLKELYGSRVGFEKNEEGVEVVRSIDGVDSDDNHEWKLFVNGKVFEKDPSTYTTADTDLLEWRLSESTLLTDPNVMY